DCPGHRLAAGEPLLVARPDHGNPAGSAGVLGVGLGPGVQPGPAGLSDLVLGGVPGVVPGLLPDLHGLRRPPRRTRRRGRTRRHEPQLNRTYRTPTVADVNGEDTIMSDTTTESAQDTVRPFRIDVPQGELDELRRRIEVTRWPTRELVTDRSQGVQLA